VGNAKGYSDLVGKELAAKTKDKKRTHTGERHIRATPLQINPERLCPPFILYKRSSKARCSVLSTGRQQGPKNA
jgi:hypothetical protein